MYKIKIMRLLTKVAYNTIMQIISKVITALLGLAVVTIMTRYLGRTGFGQYTTIITFLSFFGIFSDLGLTLTTAQMISQPGADQNKILSNLFTLRLVSAVIFLGLAPLTVLFFPYDYIIKIGVLITSLSFLFASLNQILIGLFQKNLRMDKVSIAEIANRIFLLTGVAIAIRLDWGLWGILIMVIISSLINFLLLYLFSFRFARIKLDFDRLLWKKILKISWPLALTIIFNLIYLKADTLILSLIKTQAEVGLYGASYRVIDVLIIFPFMFSGLLLPILAGSWAAGKKIDFYNILQKSFDAMAIVAIPLAVGAQFLASPIMALVGGQEFAASGPILQILILAASIIYLGNIFSHAIIAVNKQKKIIGVYVFTSVTALAGYIIFIPKFSYFGAAWVTIYSELIISLASLFFVWKFTKFLPKINILLKSFTASIIMGGGLYGAVLIIGQLNLFITLIFGAIIYFTCLYLFGGFKFIACKEIINSANIKNNKLDS